MHYLLFFFLFSQALKLPDDVLNQREVVHVDIASDLPSSGEPVPEHLDCTKFTSKKTGRGPLQEGWRVSKEGVVGVVC